MTKKDSIWCYPFITFDVNREEKKKYYGAFLRCNHHLIEKLHELENKVLEYWCANSKLCHGSILIILYHEKYGEEKDGEFEKERKRKKIDDIYILLTMLINFLSSSSLMILILNAQLYHISNSKC